MGVGGGEGGSLTWTLLSRFDGGTEALTEGVVSVLPASGSSYSSREEKGKRRREAEE